MNYILEGNRLRNSRCEWIAEIRDNKIYDTHSNLIAVIDGDKILDSRWNLMAKIELNRVVDSRSNKIAEVTEPSKHIANAGQGPLSVALWMFFVR